MKRILTEQCEFMESSGDAGSRQMRQVLIRAGTSKNNTHYSADVLKAAAPLFDNARTYANHSETDARNVLDTTGWLSNVHYDENLNALIGTRHFLDTSAGNDVYAMASLVAKGNAPDSLMGASIFALGRGSEKDGIHHVEAITDVLSVDDVDTPAAGGGFPLQEGKSLVQTILADVSYEEWRKSRPDYHDRLRKEFGKARQTTALKEANDKIADLETLRKENEQLRNDLEKLELERRVERLIAATSLPRKWKESLTSRLLNSGENDWQGIVDEELSKAAAVRANVPATQSRQAPATISASSNRGLPPDGMNVREYANWKSR